MIDGSIEEQPLKKEELDAQKKEKKAKYVSAKKLKKTITDIL